MRNNFNNVIEKYAIYSRNLISAMKKTAEDDNFCK